MLEIQEHIATEELLKMYFFKLYDRKNEFGDLYFFEDRLNFIINCKTLSQMNSNELFDCIKIERRGFGIDSIQESFDNFIPSKFYFIDDIGNSNETIFEHSFLYTNFKLIDGLNLYEAEIGLWRLGCDLINENGVILKTVTPNLYDNGFYDIKVFTKNYPVFLLTISDENNGDYDLLYSLNDNQLIEIDEIDDKILILDFLKFGGSCEILSLASAEIRDDKSIVLKAVSQDGDSLEYASDKLKNDREVVLVAVLNSGRTLKYASDELKNDKEVVLLAVYDDGRALKYASDQLKNDKEVVRVAVSKTNNYSVDGPLSINNSKKSNISQNDIDENFDNLPF